MKRVKLLAWMFFLSFLSPVQASPGSGLSMNADSVKMSRGAAGIDGFGHWNYMIETVYLEATPTGAEARSVTNVTYYDGFWRQLQEVMVQASPDKTADIVVPHAYGVFGRVEREYLPYARASKQGNLHRDALEVGNWSMYGSAEASYAYTLINYEGLDDRVKKRTGPGAAWHVAGKGVVTTYGSNEAGKVRHYRVSLDGTLTLAGTYPAGVLRLTTVTDEDGKLRETYIDGQNREILSVGADGTTRQETYSVYDDRGLLRYVLSPEASALPGTTIDETVLRRLAYRYDYDRKGRQVEKRLPGCDPVYMVYDRKDRLVMSQDGNQRAEDSKKWSYSLYDGKNRVVETGEVVLTTTSTHAALQSAASSSLNYIPGGTRTALQYTLYDTYTATADVPVRAFVPTTGYSAGYSTLVIGLVTSVKTRVLGTDTWLVATTYYDDRGRVIQTVSDNLRGFTSRVDMKYDFAGNVIKQRESHRVSTSQTDVLERENSYDDRGRLISGTTRLNGGAPATESCTYDAVGRLIKQKYGNVEETINYNTRGWLTGKESIPFKMKLRYENPEGGTAACWNGNISEWEWQHGTSTALMYGFMYDGVNRLKESVQKRKSGVTWDLLPGNYLEKGLTYDRNGNIKTLQRTAEGTLVDNLVYSYTGSGNQLTGLTENVRSVPAGDVYAPGSAATGSYSYDKNGNMISDSRGALNLSYSVLNLLREVKAGGTVKARYGYLADGTKLRVRDAGDNGFDYLGSLTYKSSSAGLQLESANFGNGVISFGTSGQEVNYFLTDHLGSVRVIVDGGGVVKERNDYYPFGAKHARGDYPQLTANRYKYNGKEEQVTGNLKYLDYGARLYDNGLGRWFGVDPKAEKYFDFTPYNYCANNPSLFVDPNGEDWFFNQKDGSVYYDTFWKMGAVSALENLYGKGWVWFGANNMFEYSDYAILIMYGTLADPCEILMNTVTGIMERGIALFKGVNGQVLMQNLGFDFKQYEYLETVVNMITYVSEGDGSLINLSTEISKEIDVLTYQYVKHEYTRKQTVLVNFRYNNKDKLGFYTISTIMKWKKDVYREARPGDKEKSILKFLLRNSDILLDIKDFLKEIDWSKLMKK